MNGQAFIIPFILLSYVFILLIVDSITESLTGSDESEDEPK